MTRICYQTPPSTLSLKISLENSQVDKGLSLKFQDAGLMMQVGGESNS